MAASDEYVNRYLPGRSRAFGPCTWMRARQCATILPPVRAITVPAEHTAEGATFARYCAEGPGACARTTYRDAAHPGSLATLARSEYHDSMKHSDSPALALLCALLLACGDDGHETAGAHQTSQPTTNSNGVTSIGTDAASTSSTASTSATDTATGGSGSESATTGEPEATSTGEASTTTTTTSGVTTSNTTQPNTTGAPPACATSLQMTVRDFKIEHPDFEDFTGDTAYKGIVLTDLGPDKKPVYASQGPTPQTSGPANFLQWYNTTDGVNVDFEIEIPLTEIKPGQYSYQNSAFFPIDGQGWGNEGNPHNFHFTTEIHTEFTYQGGEVFTFTGDDDLWLFINGKLAIDLGGLHPQLSDTIDLDAEAGFFDVQIGGTYPMDIFHAERHTDQSNYRIDTSIKCFTIPG